MSMRARLGSINEMLCALTARGNRAMVNREMSSLCVSKFIVLLCIFPFQLLQSYKELLTLARKCVWFFSAVALES